MADTITPLLLDAKKEYTMRLSEIMSPFVIQFIDATYRSAKKEVGERKAYIEFQERLRQVPTWNSAIIAGYTRDIENKYAYFSDLMAAVFVTYVKVLSSIKISAQRPSVKLKLPTNEAFVHQVYIYTAKNFYENPYAVRDSQQTKAGLVLNAIEIAVRNMLPLGDVLQAYLSSAVNDDNTMNPVLSPAQSVDENHEVQEMPESDSESDFDEGEERIIPGVSEEKEEPVISPINHPFPAPNAPTPPPSAPLPSPFPSAPTPPSQAFVQPTQPQYSHPPPPPPHPRPLFDDAIDGEHQFR